MKFRILTLAFLVVSVSAFAQKKEVRQAERAVDNNEFDNAQELLKQVEPDVSSLNKRYKGRYYTTKGKTLLNLSSANASLDGFKEAAESFKKAKEYGNEDEGEEGVAAVKDSLVNSGVNAQNVQDYEEAYKKIHAAYEMSPQDTIYLFAAANNAFNADKDDIAAKWYKKLRDIGYKGNAVHYYAVEKESGEKQMFPDEEQRDLMVKAGQYEDPTKEQDEPKDGDVIRQLAVIYIRNGEKDKAIQAIKEAKKANPEDVALIKAEAQIYQEMEKSDKFKEAVQTLLEKDPDNAGTYYGMLGNAAIDDGDAEKAEEYYKKAVEENPEDAETYSVIGSVILKKQEDVVKQMNQLGMSDEDQKEYDSLQEQRKTYLKEALPYLEKAHKYDDENVNTIRTLYQIQTQLKNEEEAQKYKELMEGGQADD